MKRILKIQSLVLTTILCFTAIPVHSHSATNQHVTSSKAIFASSTPFYSLENFTTQSANIEPRYNSTEHQEQCDYVAQQLNLSSQQTAWMKESTSIVDSKFKSAEGFHARKGTNYLANLKALFLFSKSLGSGGDMISNIINKMPNLSSTEEHHIRIMFESILEYFASKPGASLEQQRFYVYGFAIHLTGDMFAHRVLIKKSTLNSWGQADTSTKKNFQNRDFLDSKRADFKNAIKNEQLYMTDMKAYMQPEGFTFKIFGGTTTRRGAVYIDNTTFMPNRFMAAKKTAASFVKNALNGSFNDISYHRGEYNLTLENFSTYKSVI